MKKSAQMCFQQQMNIKSTDHYYVNNNELHQIKISNILFVYVGITTHPLSTVLMPCPILLDSR